MVTTIQVSNSLKEELAQLKKEKTYEQLIKQLLQEHKRKEVAADMKEFGQKYAAQELKELKEWEHTELAW